LQKSEILSLIITKENGNKNVKAKIITIEEFVYNTFFRGFAPLSILAVKMNYTTTNT